MSQEIIKEKQQVIQWRKHELVFVTAIAFIALAGRLWYVFQHQADLQTPFDQTSTAFNLYRNVIIPDIARGLMLFLVYVLLHLSAIPIIKSNYQNKKKDFLKLVSVLCAAIVLTGIVFNFAEYYIRQWQFNYPGFSIFFNKNNPNSQMSISANFFFAAVIIIICLLYLLAREYIITVIERSRQRAFNISVCNKVTVFAFTLLAVYFFLNSFQLINERDALSKYIFIISGLFAIFISNVYWLFPLKGEASFFSSRILVRLLSTSFIYAIPLTVLVHESGTMAMLYSWALQLFIVTPLTWLYFSYNKERILRLRVTQKELEQSKADLQFLRSQVNPHFLFNTLNTLYGTALQENADRTAEGIQMLGDMMRFMLHENHLDFINMQQEIQYLQNYIALQKLRIATSNKITITNNIDTVQCNHPIAPMLLIPLVENAFKHGISLQETSWINVQLHCDEHSIAFQVNNSLHVKQVSDTEKNKSGVGLNNVRERLKLIYPGRFEFHESQTASEFTVKLSINL